LPLSEQEPHGVRDPKAGGAMKPVACIVMPTYNEAKNLPLILPRIFAQQQSIPTHELHVLVVDDDSPDGTQAEVREEMKRWPKLHLITGVKRGLGDAYQRGMEHALSTLRPDLLFEMDADLQHNASLLPEFVAHAKEGYSVVIGSRFVAGGATPDFPFHRRLISVVGNWLARRAAGLRHVRDITSGYRCIKGDLLARCDFHRLATRGYAFQTSLLAELVRNGGRVLEIPIIFPDREFGRSKLSPRDYFEFLWVLAKLRTGKGPQRERDPN
jgi:dolichol-phosphate mannosyltransferase